jgi:hypothetical protein
MNTKTVYIPRIPEHDAYDGIYVTVKWVCPVCGGPRGDIYTTVSYDGGRRLHCDGWVNPCGHVDQYADVVREVMQRQASAN